MSGSFVIRTDWQRLIHQTVLNDVERALLEFVIFDGDEEVQAKNYRRIKIQTLMGMSSITDINYERYKQISSGDQTSSKEDFELAVAACAFTPYPVCVECGVPEELIHWMGNSFTGLALEESIRRNSNV